LSDSELCQTSAHALHNILHAIKNTPGDTLQSAWSTVLSVEWRSPEFARRHSEVVRLWNATVTQIEALPQDRTKSRMRGYTSTWWSAVIMPEAHWNNTTMHPSKIISDSDLDHLESAADLILTQLGGAASAPAGTDLQTLRVQCEEWLTLLENRVEITDDRLRLELREQIRHLIWLIDNAIMFGVSRIVEHGDQVTGALIRTVYSGTDTVRNPKEFVKRIAGFVAALAMITTFLGAVNPAIKAADRDVQAIEQFVHDITHDDVAEEQTKR
jgi:hypothetical protein